MKLNKLFYVFGCILFCSLLKAQTFDFLFIHHSVGRNWLNDGLRASLQDPTKNKYTFRVHDATYGDEIGQATDVCDWYPKFRDDMKKVRTFDKHPNIYYKTPGRYNRIIMFKSCFPNSGISSVGTPPGNPTDCRHTIWNHKAAYNACANIFKKYPHTLFVAVTAPPLNPYSTNKADAARAREFHNWLKTTWVQDYRKNTGLWNVVTFDLFDILANPPNHPTEPNMLRKEYRSGGDSHPTKPGNIAATKAFIPFINQAVTDWLNHSNGGCPGTGGKMPKLSMIGQPKIGNSNFKILLSNSKPNSSIVILAGKNTVNIPLGGGCRLIVGNPWIPFPGMTNSTGNATLAFPIPNNQNLVGAHVYMQGFVYDSNGPIGPGLLVSSNVLAFNIF